MRNHRYRHLYRLWLFWSCCLVVWSSHTFISLYHQNMSYRCYSLFHLWGSCWTENQHFLSNIHRVLVQFMDCKVIDCQGIISHSHPVRMLISTACRPSTTWRIVKYTLVVFCRTSGWVAKELCQMDLKTLLKCTLQLEREWHCSL